MSSSRLRASTSSVFQATARHRLLRDAGGGLRSELSLSRGRLPAGDEAPATHEFDLSRARLEPTARSELSLSRGRFPAGDEAPTVTDEFEHTRARLEPFARSELSLRRGRLPPGDEAPRARASRRLRATRPAPAPSPSRAARPKEAPSGGSPPCRRLGSGVWGEEARPRWLTMAPRESSRSRCARESHGAIHPRRRATRVPPPDTLPVRPRPLPF